MACMIMVSILRVYKVIVYADVYKFHDEDCFDLMMLCTHHSKTDWFLQLCFVIVDITFSHCYIFTLWQRPKFLRSRTNYQAINADTLRAQNIESGGFFNQVSLTPSFQHFN